MSTMRNYAEVETWTVKELIDAATLAPQGPNKITIPEFQRRLVWSKDKQEKLILSIKSGFPFGSLLLYEDTSTSNQRGEGKRLYKLIDGLQRTQALIKYTEDPNSFFTKTDVPDDFIDTLKREFDLDTEAQVTNLKRAIVKWVRSLKGFTETDGWGTGNMTRALVEEIWDEDSSSNNFATAVGEASMKGLLQNAIAGFLRDVREEADISAAKIPIIIYTGPTSDLPTVFELLNSQGTALSRYEIFAAQWIDERQQIANRDIIDAIWRKYEALEDEGFTLDVTEEAPDSKSKKERKYSLFEYLFGLGQHLSSEYKLLFRSVSADRPSSAGFNLVSACAGLNVKDMDRLPQQIESYDLAELEERILKAVEFVDETLKPILEVRQKGRKSISIYHSEFQIISIIATAFRVRYAREDLSEVGGWQANWHKLEHNLRMFYLYDIMRDYWRGSGDSKLNDVVQKLRYLNNPPSEDAWRQVFDAWFTDNQITQAHVKRYVRDQTPEILMLKYIYAQKFTVMEGAKRYHVEHVVPVDQITSVMGKDDKWPINIVSNLALLEAKENIEKGNLTFAEYWNKQADKGKISDKQRSQKIRESEQRLLCPVEMLPDEITQKTYEDFLLQRFDYLVECFLDEWEEYVTDNQA